MMLIKFKQCNLSDLYLDLTKVVGIRPSLKNGNSTLANNTLNTYTGVNIGYDEPGNTVILIDNNCMFFIEEHISEVIALMEGRDPRPAKVLFGKKE